MEKIRTQSSIWLMNIRPYSEMPSFRLQYKLEACQDVADEGA